MSGLVLTNHVTKRTLHFWRLSRALCAPLMIAVFLLGNPARADFEDGWAASLRGDHAAALREWRPLADQGHAPAQYNIGQMYRWGYGVAQDHGAAARWFRLAAENGSAKAAYNLGHMFQHGYGVPQDLDRAVYWFRLAASQGHVRAQFNLAVLYRAGAASSAEAARWYQLAAEQGDVDAQHNLGLLFAEGRGVAPDPVEALKWYTLAAAQGDELARAKHRQMTDRLPPKDVAEAHRRARAWRAKDWDELKTQIN